MLMPTVQRLPSLTTEQQLFILTHLAFEKTYTVICQLFLEQYKDFGSGLDAEVVASRLYDTIRKLKRSRAEEIAEIGKNVVRSQDPDYRFKYLDKMLHDTPDVEVIYSTPEGIEKKQCNRAIKVKMIELMERIDGTFDRVGSGYRDMHEPPVLVPDPFGPPPNYAEEMARYQSGNKTSDVSESDTD